MGPKSRVVVDGGREDWVLSCKGRGWGVRALVLGFGTAGLEGISMRIGYWCRDLFDISNMNGLVMYWGLGLV